MDIVERIVLFLSLILFSMVVGIPMIWGFSWMTVLLSVVVAFGGIYVLFFANTPLRANSYRKLDTPWTEKVNKQKPHQEYPRPQLVRKTWINLNDEWDYVINKNAQVLPKEIDGKILVPFPLESHLSGVARRLKPDEYLWYKTCFAKPAIPFDTLLLHFGAVDWHSRVFINGNLIGEHHGGHTGFSFDIAPYLVEGVEQTLMLCVSDPTNKGPQPRGKQVLRPGNIYYTPVSGIWQTVWLEPLAAAFFNIPLVSVDIHTRKVSIDCKVNDFMEGDVIQLEVFLNSEKLLEKHSSDTRIIFTLDEDKFHLWSETLPVLYDVKLKLLRDGKIIDEAGSYFACRKIEIKKDTKGFNRLFLNNVPKFQLGLLDQGWWPDGLYTAPTDEALRYDIEISKAMGFNMIRKHVKVEPARWYYHCDRLGMLVWQDMPTGDRNILPKQKDIVRSDFSTKVFHAELEEMIEQLRFFKSIVCWVPFNEGWGQFNTNEVIAKVKALDPERLVDGPSGWVDRGKGDMHDYHIYNRKLFIGKPEENRAQVIGEFGGIGYRLKEHMAVTNSWSYKNTKNPEHLALRYEKLFKQQLLPLLEKGLAAVVYTQTTDVESEINGLLTYDRKVEKIPVERLAKLHQAVYQGFDEIV